MNESLMVILSIAYCVIMFVVMGFLLGKRDERNEHANLGDVIATILWPAFLLVCLGYLFGRKDD